jgi:hypothetical protein
VSVNQSLKAVDFLLVSFLSLVSVSGDQEDDSVAAVSFQRESQERTLVFTSVEWSSNQLSPSVLFSNSKFLLEL